MATEKISNMQRFAELSGISRPTISRYFNDPRSVRPSTRRKIEEALETYDYRPNIFAISQNRRMTKNVGIVVPYIADPFFAEIIRHLERRFVGAGYWPVVLSSHGETKLEISALRTLKSLKPTGAVLAPLGKASDSETLEAFCASVPTLVLDNDLDLGGAFVGTDNFQSIGLIVDYLYRTGEPPCYLDMPEVNANALERRQAYIQAMERLALIPHVIPVEEHGWSFEEVGYTKGLKMISSGNLPSKTVLCANDRIAIGLLSAAYEFGLRVGHGPGCAMRIAGHDNHPLSRFTCPPLTTVSQDYEAIATRAVDQLFRFISEGGQQEKRPLVRLKGTLIMRASA